MMLYNPRDWYWTGPLGIFSSKANTLVPDTDEVYISWLASGYVATPWPKDIVSGEQTTEALDGILVSQGLPHTGLGVLKVPISVALWRAKAILYGTAFLPSSAKPEVSGLLTACTTLGEAADTLVAAQNSHVLSAFWVAAGDIYRSSAALAQIADLLNLSSNTIDAMFIAAQEIPPL
jgi:hypothetical protein